MSKPLHASVLGAFVLSGILGLAGSAHAVVAQPNGTVVPIHVNNGETQVDDKLKQLEPGIDFKADASNIPETFSPLCSFTASLILRQTGSNLAIGWYNVIPGATQKPADSEIYVVVPKGSQVGGPPITAAKIKDDANYKGGLIGFALVGDVGFTTKFTEKKWNQMCTNTTNCPTPGPWIHSITYASKTTPNAFYLGFEDGNASADTFGNDGDYNDYFFLFTGLTCNGGGKPCDVPGEKGICSAGVTRCNAGGTVCTKVINAEATERCDGLDNNCNGTVDEDAPCPTGLICDRGKCVTQCSGEFGCAPGNTCEDGRCIDMACKGITCDGASTCRQGKCVSPCTDVVCPGSQTCRAGRCVEPCEGVTCPMGQACSNGVCITGCDCYPCGDPALGCSTKTNLCVAKDCLNVTCGAGDVCRNGVCVGACVGAKCPNGLACEEGRCQEPNSTDPDGTNPDGTNPDGEGGGSLATGCACKISPDSSRPGTLAISASLLVLGALFFRRRRAQGLRS